MRQYADGAWLHRNLFTTLPQTGHQLNIFFLVLGKVSALTGLAPITVYHACRVAAALLVPILFWRLTGVLGLDALVRRCALLVTAFGAGLGWLPGLYERGFGGPVDLWQPEALTFLSLYLFPLFGVSMALMLLTWTHLIQAEQERSLRHAAWAGFWGFLLANIHTYDIIPLSIVWLAFLSISLFLARKSRMFQWPSLDRGAFPRLLVAGVPTAVSFGYMLWILRTEKVFALRVATETLTPGLHWVLLGFGLSIPLALWGIAAGIRPRRNAAAAPNAVLFLVLWAVLHIAAAYLPVPFQRKMLMGAQWPIGILAGMGLAALLSRVPERRRALVLTATVVLLSLTNIRFMLRDRGSVRYGGDIVRAFLLPGEHQALLWLRQNVPPGTPIQPLPWIAVSSEGRSAFADTTLACFAPGVTGLPVHAGHWGETPEYGRTMGQWVRFLLPNTDDQWRRELLRESGVRYLVFSQKRPETRDAAADAVLTAWLSSSGPPYLRKIPEASNEDADVYEVTEP